ncbi:hypothetical protein COOONC_09569 [Cooperia oncophora]
MGNATTFGKIRFLRKGTAWARDNWMTNSKWNDERDFMIHNWKLTQLRTYRRDQYPKSDSAWYNPLAGPIVLSMCTWGNTTWRYDKNLLATREEIDNRLLSFAREVDKRRAHAMSQVRELRKRWLSNNKWKEMIPKGYL